MNAKPDWLDRAEARAASAPNSAPRLEEVGRVESVADGVAVLSGLATARLDELLRFDKGYFGFVQTLDRDSVSCILLDGLEAVEAGDARARHRRGGARAGGAGLLGRVVDPLGRPLDEKGPVAADSASCRSNSRRPPSSSAIW